MEAELQRAWVNQAQADADRDVLECRMCKQKGPLEEAITLWRNGILLFAVCERCAGRHEVVMRPTERGIEIRARATTPLIVGNVHVR